MALQGNLRDFASSEILQLIGTQKKSGCLTLEWNSERARVWVNEGRIVSTRQPGMAGDDPLLAFLLKTKRLSDVQHRGILVNQRESNRDLEDLLLNGRYLDAQELALYLERQILDDLQRVVRWDNGSYRFDPNAKWPNRPVVSLSMEGALIEASRRVDEQKRFVTLFKDPHQLLGVRDLPDPSEPLSEEERELFGLVDGQHTVAEIVEAAPLSEYEVYESLQRMHDSSWIEFVGRRAPGKTPPPPPSPIVRTRPRQRPKPLQEIAVALVILAAVFGLREAGERLPAGRPAAPAHDVFAAAQVRDIRYTLDLYRREQGRYPERLSVLVDDRWLARDQVRVPGYALVYHSVVDGQAYRLELLPDR